MCIIPKGLFNRSRLLLTPFIKTMDSSDCCLRRYIVLKYSVWLSAAIQFLHGNKLLDFTLHLPLQEELKSQAKKSAGDYDKQLAEVHAKLQEAHL